MSRKQTKIPGVDAPYTMEQEAAILFLEADEERQQQAERAKKLKLEMVRAARRQGVDVIKVRHPRTDDLVVFDFSNDVKVKKTTLPDIKIEKVEKEAAASAGGRGS